jgi:hypothetical protein
MSHNEYTLYTAFIVAGQRIAGLEERVLHLETALATMAETFQKVAEAQLMQLRALSGE